MTIYSLSSYTAPPTSDLGRHTRCQDIFPVPIGILHLNVLSDIQHLLRHLFNIKAREVASRHNAHLLQRKVLSNARMVARWEGRCALSRMSCSSEGSVQARSDWQVVIPLIGAHTDAVDKWIAHT